MILVHRIQRPDSPNEMGAGKTDKTVFCTILHLMTSAWLTILASSPRVSLTTKTLKTPRTINTAADRSNLNGFVYPSGVQVSGIFVAYPLSSPGCIQRRPLKIFCSKHASAN